MKFADVQVGREYARQRGTWDPNTGWRISRVRVLDNRPFVKRPKYTYDHDTITLQNGITVTTALIPLGDSRRQAGAVRHVAVETLNSDTGEPVVDRGPHFVSIRELHVPWSEYQTIKAERDQQRKRVDEAQERHRAKIAAERNRVYTLTDPLGLTRVEIRPSALDSWYEIRTDALTSLLEHAQRTGWKWEPGQRLNN